MVLRRALCVLVVALAVLGAQASHQHIVGQTWQPFEQLPMEPRAWFAPAMLPAYNKVLMIGGAFSNGTITNEVWFSWGYGHTWHASPTPAFSPRKDAQAFALDEHLLAVYGGKNDTHVLGDVWVSEDGGFNFIHASSTLPPRVGAAVAKVGSEAIIIGGRDHAFELASTVLKATYSYPTSSVTQTVVQANPPFSPRAHAALTYAPDNAMLFMLGGEDDSGALSDMWRSSDFGATWTQVEGSGLGARTRARALFALGSLLVLGGEGETQWHVFASQDFGNEWQVRSFNSSFLPRSGFGAVAMPSGTVLVFGGARGGVILRDMWASFPEYSDSNGGDKGDEVCVLTPQDAVNHCAAERGAKWGWTCSDPALQPRHCGDGYIYDGETCVPMVMPCDPGQGPPRD